MGNQDNSDQTVLTFLNKNWDAIDMTDFQKIESYVKGKFLPTLIKPEMLNASVSLYPTCTSCKKRITVAPGEQKFSCESCHRRIVTKKLWIGFLTNMGIINNDET